MTHWGMMGGFLSFGLLKQSYSSEDEWCFNFLMQVAPETNKKQIKLKKSFPFAFSFLAGLCCLLDEVQRRLENLSLH